MQSPLPACLSLVLLAAQQESAPKLDLLPHAELAREMTAIAGAHPELVQLMRLGESRAGRAIDALRITAPAEEGHRPAILLVANLDGPRLFAGAVALEHARALAAGYGSDEKVKALLDSTVVFVVPRANPDAAEARFATPRIEAHASGPGVDDDRDGRAGEDPPADLDGDGLVTWIRVPDPDGEWKEDPTDARALVKADAAKGERGVYLLWPEGRDADADERVAEDQTLDARVDKNFPAGWEAHRPESGLFPTDEPETRALCDFVLGHPELALVVVYDEQDDLVGEVKSVADDAPNVKRVPPEGVLESDAKLLGELAKRFRKATESTVDPKASDRGTFSRWCYEHRGLFTLSTALWDIPLEEKKKDTAKEGESGGAEEKKEGGEKSGAAEAPKSEAAAQEPATEKPAGDEKAAEKADDKGKDKKKDDEPKPSDDAKRLRWIDAAGAEEAWRFHPWTAYTHPELGPVEIGGLVPFARFEPPASERAEIAQKHFDFFLTLGALLSRVSISECTREKLGDGVHRVTAVIQNDGFLPLLSRSARRTETVRPAKVRLVLPEAAKRLGGNVQELVYDLPGSGGRKEFTWLVHGPDGMELGVSVETTHAGTAFQKAEEKPR